MNYHDVSKYSKENIEGYILAYKKFDLGENLTDEENKKFENAWGKS